MTAKGEQWIRMHSNIGHEKAADEEYTCTLIFESTYSQDTIRASYSVAINNIAMLTGPCVNPGYLFILPSEVHVGKVYV